MAEVFRAQVQGLGRARRDVAVKRMLPHLADEPEFVELFFREAQVASTLNHPNLVGVLESGEYQGTYFLAMELVQGVTLRDLIRAVHSRDEPFDLGVAVFIVSSVCGGLHHAHEREDVDGRPLGIVHRDVSPGNVFVSWDGAVKLGDFGVATATAEWTAIRSTTGSIRGKVAYMAPEQARGQPVDRRADVFALGNVLFELVEGRRLLQARGEVEMLHELVFEGHGGARPRREDCPATLADIVERALQRAPEARYPTARALQQDLEICAREQGISLTAAEVADYVRARCDRPVTEPQLAEPRLGAASDTAAPVPSSESASAVLGAPNDPTATLDVPPTTRGLGPPHPRESRRGRWSLALLGGAGVATAAVLVWARPESSRPAGRGLDFATLQSAGVPTSVADPPPPAVATPPEPGPKAETGPEIEPTPRSPTVRTKPRRKKRSPRARDRATKTGSTKKPPPGESLFPK